MNVEILTIGDELLLGETIDTNAAWLSRELAALGVTVTRRTTVGDHLDHIVAAIRDALQRTGAVITTGGLGPTADDMTTAAVAAAFDRTLDFDEAQWERIRALWRSRLRGEPPEANRRQVMLPAGARVLLNGVGTAPGVLVEDERGWTATLPGVPREMRAMFAEQVVPLLRDRLQTSGRATVVRSRTLRTTGVPESSLPGMLGPLAQGFPRASLAYLPGIEGVDLRSTVRDVAADEADALLTEYGDALRERLGDVVYAEGARDLAEVVLDLCRARGLTIALGESCTGGLLGARLTAISGSSDVVLGGVVAYSNAVKERVLGVPAETIASEGAVSEATVRAMAAGARSLLGASVGLGVTGIAGPTGATPGKPVGLVWLCVDLGDRSRAIGPVLVGDRAEIRFRATQAILEMLRREIG